MIKHIQFSNLSLLILILINLIASFETTLVQLLLNSELQKLAHPCFLPSVFFFSFSIMVINWSEGFSELNVPLAYSLEFMRDIERACGTGTFATSY